MSRASVLLSLALFCGACSSDDDKSDDSGGEGTSDGADGADGSDGGDGADGGDGGVEVEAVCTEPTDMTCVDALILDLSLHDDKVSDGDVTTTVDGDDFVTVVDASAGGYSAAASNPWVYVRFTPEGAERVEIDDETALESMQWHMGLRRFIVRLNGGTSGPSCVGAATLAESEYADLTGVPDGLGFRMDDYYTDDCTIINDSSGLPGSPQVVLGQWWSYSGCVETSMKPHLVQLDDGHVIRLRIETYYGRDQDVCNATGAGGEDSGIITMRWQYVL